MSDTPDTIGTITWTSLYTNLKLIEMGILNQLNIMSKEGTRSVVCDIDISLRIGGLGVINQRWELKQ